MTDRKLLEDAAKAAGIELDWEPTAEENGQLGPWRNDTTSQQWNPLFDDGDAFRLAVKLNLAIESTSGVSVVVCADYGNNGYDIEVFELLKNTDPLAATRRAIVRAAAEIGRGMT